MDINQLTFGIALDEYIWTLATYVAMFRTPMYL